MIFDNINEYVYVSRRGKNINIFFCSLSVFTCMGSHPFKRHQHSCSISIHHELKWIWLLIFHVVYQKSWSLYPLCLYPHTNERCWVWCRVSHKPVQSMLLDSCSWTIRKYRFSKESWAVPGDASLHTIFFYRGNPHGVRVLEVSSPTYHEQARVHPCRVHTHTASL